MIIDTFKLIQKEEKFSDSVIFNKLESKMELLNEKEHFASTMKLAFSGEKLSKTMRGSCTTPLQGSSNREGKFI